MPAMTIRNISPEAHHALKKRAAARGMSAEAEVRSMLEAAVPTQQRSGLGTRLAAIGKKHGGWDLDLKRDQTPTDPAIF